MIDEPAENRPALREDGRGGSAPIEERGTDPSGRLRPLGSGDIPEPDVLVRLAAAAVPHSDHVCLSTARPDSEQVHTLACSDDVADALDAAQREAGNGPFFDVRRHREIVHVPDLATDLRWPEFAPCALAMGTRAVLAVHLETANGEPAALTFYADHAHAFEPLDVEIAAVFGSFVAIAMQGARYRDQAVNLELALESNRQIGTAIGILMARELLTAEQAFARLRDASQRRHRKLRAIADEVVATGELPRSG